MVEMNKREMLIGNSEFIIDTESELATGIEVRYKGHLLDGVTCVVVNGAVPLLRLEDVE